MINKEIGALVGRPLVWTQNDDEVTAFRQTMTRFVTCQLHQHQTLTHIKINSDRVLIALS
jgi:hypothetical protein